MVKIFIYNNFNFEKDVIIITVHMYANLKQLDIFLKKSIWNYPGIHQSRFGDHEVELKKWKEIKYS